MFKRNKKHKDCRGFVFEVNASVVGGVQADRDLGACFVSFCRGRRKTTSDGVYLDDDSKLDFPEPLEGMMVTLYKKKKEPEYEEKIYKFLLEERDDEAGEEGQPQVLGSVEINMAEYLTMSETKADTLQLVMDAADGVDVAAIQVDLSWSFLKEGSPNDEDVMSTLSADAEDTGEGGEGHGNYVMPTRTDDDEDDEDADDDSEEDEEDDDEDEEDDDDVEFDEREFIVMRLSVFFQESGEEVVSVAGHPRWTLSDVREALMEETADRGLWVFMADGAPLDPEEEAEIAASEHILEDDGDDDDEDAEGDTDDLLDGYNDEEVRGKLAASLQREKSLQAEVANAQKMLAEISKSGGGDAETQTLVGMMRTDNERLKSQVEEVREDLQAQLDQKTMQAKMAAEIGQELNDKNEDLQHHLNESSEFARRLENDATSMREQMGSMQEMLKDHEDAAGVLEEERQGMEEQRYRLQELENANKMLERTMREREEAHELALQDELAIQEENLKEKFEVELKYAKKEAEQLAQRAQEQAAAIAEASDQSDLETLEAKVNKLELERDELQRNLEQITEEKQTADQESAKYREATNEAKRQRAKINETMKEREEALRDATLKMNEGEKELKKMKSDVQRMKKEMMELRRELAVKDNELSETKQLLEQAPQQSEAVVAEGSLTTGMDESSLVEMQAQVAAEYQAKYEDKIRALQARLKQADERRKKEATATKARETEAIKKAMMAAAKAAERKIAKRDAQLADAKQSVSDAKKEARVAAKAARQKALAEAKAQQSTKAPKAKKKEPVKKVEPPLEGWLMKKSDKGVVKRWYWRWFAYDAPSHKLLYYTKEGPKMEMKGAIDMKDNPKIFVLPNEIQDKCRQSFGIQIKKTNRVYFLMAGDRKMMTRWVSTLTEKCKNFKVVQNKVDKDVGSWGTAGGGAPVSPVEVDANVARANELIMLLDEAAGSEGDGLRKEAEKLSDAMVASASKKMDDGEYAIAANFYKMAENLDKTNPEATTGLAKAKIRLADVSTEVKKSVDKEKRRQKKLEREKKATAIKPVEQAAAASLFGDDDDEEFEVSGKKKAASTKKPAAAGGLWGDDEDEDEKSAAAAKPKEAKKAPTAEKPGLWD